MSTPASGHPSSLILETRDRDALSGRLGEGPRLAMRVIVAMAEATGARRLIDVTSAHVDGCLYQGEVSLDFAERLAGAGARVAVPTTLNVGAVDLLHPDRYRGPPETARQARRLMDLYVRMGCRPTWTCAPYQLREARPSLGEQVAWAESNAIAFANSVLGARTERYGDFVDVCAAVTGRVPDAGLHRSENRRGQVLVRLRGISERLLRDDVLYPVLGYLIGRTVGSRVPVIEGLHPDASEDQLKALGAAAAASGAVALFHAIGVTPEAPTMDAVVGGVEPEEVVDVTSDMLRRARDELWTARGDRLDAVSVGTPHASAAQLEGLVRLLGGRTVRIPLYVSTGRDVLSEMDGAVVEGLDRSGVTVVTDTCTYVASIMRPGYGVVMTDSGKWAYYAPGNIGVDVAFGTLEECVRSAVEGRLWRDPDLFDER
jgi:predicted aconitase